MRGPWIVAGDRNDDSLIGVENSPGFKQLVDKPTNKQQNKISDIIITDLKLVSPENGVKLLPRLCQIVHTVRKRSDHWIPCARVKLPPAGSVWRKFKRRH